MLDGLFDIARPTARCTSASSPISPRSASIFGFDETAFARIRARHVIDAAATPISCSKPIRRWDYERLRRQYRRLVAENHPDRLIARGVPEEFVRIANDRLAAINAAWDKIERRTGAGMTRARVEDRPSPNHGERTGGPIDILLLHYTGMPDDEQALAWLCNPKSKVSSHYFVHADGRVLAARAGGAAAPGMPARRSGAARRTSTPARSESRSPMPAIPAACRTIPTRRSKR